MGARIVIVIVAVSLGMSFTSVAAGRDDANVIESAVYDSDAKVQAAWPALWGTAPATITRVADRPAIALPCNFAGTKIERATWDRQVRLDLSRCTAIEVDLYSADASPISSISLYFQSGKGWYSGHLAQPNRGQWTTARIERDQMGAEGSPAGWSQIRTIRFSAWRGGEKNADLAMGAIRLIESNSSVILVRNESALAKAPGEAQSVKQFPQEMAAHLRKAGVDAVMISDIDLPKTELAPTDVVGLPHAPHLAPEAEAKLLDHIAKGGKVMAFYAITPKLAEALGVQMRGFQSGGPARAKFAQIRAEKDIAEGMPPITNQHSWNINRAAPREGHPAKPRVAAWWYDADGKPTGEAAIVLSDRGLYMTHVLLSDDAENQQRLILALAGKLSPKVLQEAANNAVRAVTQSAARCRLSEPLDAGVAERISKAPDLKQAYEQYRAKLTALQERARQPGTPPFAILDDARQMRQGLLELYAGLQPSAPGEFRAFWCHSAFGPSGKIPWDPAIKALADNGFNAIIPNMLWAGVTFYPSDVLPVSPSVQERGDQIEQCLAACRKYGVQCHVWKVNWNMGSHTSKDFVAQMKQEGRTQVKFDGSPSERWLCPSDERNQKLEIDSMVEVAKKYAVDGIHFDYIRYPGDESCFCTGCRERFEKSLGQKVEGWPTAVRKDAALKQKWNDFRRANITTVVAAVSEQARKVRPGIKISAAVFSNWAVDRDHVAQDWKLWCERGYLDFVCPMDYTPHDSAFTSLVQNQVGWAGKVPVYPGIGASVWPDRQDIVGIAEKVKSARNLSCSGFVIFEYSAEMPKFVLPMMKAGVTKEK